MEESVYQETTVSTLGRGLVSAKDRSILETKLDVLSKELNSLGESASMLVNRLTPVRRISPTTDSDALNRKEPQEHQSEITQRLEQLSAQTTYIEQMIISTLSELEL